MCTPEVFPPPLHTGSLFHCRWERLVGARAGLDGHRTSWRKPESGTEMEEDSDGLERAAGWRVTR